MATVPGSLPGAASTTETEVLTSAIVPVNVDGTTVPMSTRPGEITTVEAGNYQIAFDSVGAVIRSLNLVDRGTDALERDVETPTTGVEMIRSLPVPDPRQVMPLEISLGTSVVSRELYEAFNHVKWDANVVQQGGPQRDAIVRFNSPEIHGLRLQKTLTIPHTGYYSKLQVLVFNESGNRVTVSSNTTGQPNGLTLRWGPGLAERAPGESAEAEAAYDTALARIGSEVQVLRPGAGKEPLGLAGELEWAGIESKYFAALIVPKQPDNAAARQPFSFRTWVPQAWQAAVVGYTPPLVAELSTTGFDLEPNSSRAFEYGLYIGPKKYDVLERYGHNLQGAMYPDSFGFMRAIYLGLTDFLNFLYRFVGNYGIAIILLTMIVRLVVFPLTQKQIKIQAKTMAEMSKVKPHIDAINEKYKDNKPERDKKIWEVYKEHNISPLAPLRGCLPLLLQMPVFIGLYRVANDTIDLKGASFLWAKDLSQPDHLFSLGVSLPIVGSWFNLLPIVMGLTQVVATYVGMKRAVNMDPMQKKMMYYMPLVLTFMLYRLPSGLMVYWVTSNIWQIFQTMLTNKILENEEAKHKSAAAVVVPAPAAQDKDQKLESSAATAYESQKAGKGTPEAGKRKIVSVPDKKNK